MAILILLWYLCLRLPFVEAGYPSPYDFNPTSARLAVEDVTVPNFSESDPVPSSLFGAARNLEASSEDLLPGVHPRIAFNADEWARIVNDYAKDRLKEDTWGFHFFRYTRVGFAYLDVD